MIYYFKVTIYNKEIRRVFQHNRAWFGILLINVLNSLLSRRSMNYCHFVFVLLHSEPYSAFWVKYDHSDGVEVGGGGNGHFMWCAACDRLLVTRAGWPKDPSMFSIPQSIEDGSK